MSTRRRWTGSARAPKPWRPWASRSRNGGGSPGNIQVNGPSGDADFAVPLKGAKAGGTLYVVASKQAGRWSMEVLELEVDGREERTDLLGRSDPSAR